MVLQALENGAKLNQETLHHQELGIATLTACFVNSNRDPKKSAPVKAADFFYFQDKSLEITIPASVCDAFFSLIESSFLPGWALGLAPIEALRSGKANGPVRRPRAWVGENLLLIYPQKDGDEITAALAINNGATGLCELRDVDTGTLFCLQLPERPQVLWALEPEYVAWKSDGLG